MGHSMVPQNHWFPDTQTTKNRIIFGSPIAGSPHSDLIIQYLQNQHNSPAHTLWYFNIAMAAMETMAHL